MGIPINANIPNPPNRPSDDVVPMRANTNSMIQYVAVDHVGFSSSEPSGTHKQVTFKEFASAPPTPTPGSEESVAYSAAGQASNSTAQMVFQNGSAKFLMSCIRAFGQMAIQPGSPTVNIDFRNSHNVVVGSSSQQNGSTYTITLENNCVTGNNALVFISFSNPIYNSASFLGNTRASYSLTTNQLVIVVAVTPAVGTFINFVILQA
jgi:hypothetical protein